MDVPLQHTNKECNKCDYEVSILVLMDVPLQQARTGIYTFTTTAVSILVLMDVPLQQEKPKVSPVATVAFQSLF